LGHFSSIAVIVAMIAPWTAHNYHIFGRFILLNAK